MFSNFIKAINRYEEYVEINKIENPRMFTPKDKTRTLIDKVKVVLDYFQNNPTLLKVKYSCLEKNRELNLYQIIRFTSYNMNLAITKSIRAGLMEALIDYVIIILAEFLTIAKRIMEPMYIEKWKHEMRKRRYKKFH